MMEIPRIWNLKFHVGAMEKLRWSLQEIQLNLNLPNTQKLSTDTKKVYIILIFLFQKVKKVTKVHKGCKV